MATIDELILSFHSPFLSLHQHTTLAQGGADVTLWHNQTIKK